MKNIVRQMFREEMPRGGCGQMCEGGGMEDGMPVGTPHPPPLSSAMVGGGVAG